MGFVKNCKHLIKNIKVLYKTAVNMSTKGTKKGKNIMGMASSQARFLQLTARLNNTEFQGQQINQQRTLLSNESSQAYNSLLGMTVPTPPSKTDFTKTVYTFNQGSYNYTIDSVYPNANNQDYTINYVRNGNLVGIVNTNTSATIRRGTNPNSAVSGDAVDWLANGSQLYEVNANFVHEGKTGEELFQQLFNNTQGAEMSDYYVYIATDANGVESYKFIAKEDVESIGITQTESGLANIWEQGTVNVNEQLTTNNGAVIFDTSGRMTSVIIDGQEFVLTAETLTDDAAYEDAYNQYEYEKYQYNQYVAEVNAKISIIQLQDKKLELQLEQLDTERTTITTEIEAVQKVLTDNIDRTYKVFNG